MAKHRAQSAQSRRRQAMVTGVKRAVAPSLGSAAAVATVAAVGAPAPAEAPEVDLAALVVEGSSTNPTGEGIPEFYNDLFNPEGTTVVGVNFFTGPFGVYDALQTNEGPNVVLSSGWGAANISLLLTYMDLTNSNDPDLTEPLYVLDNNVARPNGGFGTRYPIFALIGVNPIPTPTDPGAEVIDVGYEYDINGNTPAYVLNGVSMANSLATYFDNRLNQSEVVLPVNPDGTLDPEVCDADCQAELAAGEEVVTTVDGRDVVLKRVGTTTYISYRTDGLPLLEPLRTYGGEPGRQIAFIVEPALTAVVDYGYPDNDALANPDEYVPARLVPRPSETQTFLQDFGAGVLTGIDRLDDEVPGDDEPIEVSGVERLTQDDESGSAATESDDDDESSAAGPRLRPFSGVRHTLRALHDSLHGDDDAAEDDATQGDGNDEEDDAGQDDAGTPESDET